jgi:hypothetical protein
MMVAKTSIDNMATEIMKGLNEYAGLCTDTMKTAVTETGKEVKKDIQATAPVRTGKYKKSWTTKKVAENSNSIIIVVHSKDCYQIAHLLEHGHAKRGGGRVNGRPHIAPAEQSGVESLKEKIERGLS